MEDKNNDKLTIMDLILLLSKGLAEKKYFGTRRKLNEEFIEYAKKPEVSKEFWTDINKIRIENNIPALNPSEDVDCFPICNDEIDYIDCESEWLSSQEEKFQKNFEKEVYRLITKYGLPKNFSSWLQDVILYNQIPPWNPFYNWELQYQIGDKKLPSLYTGEKEFIKNYFRKRLSIKRRPPKENTKLYKKLCLILKSSQKPKRRSLKTLSTVLKTFERGEISREYDPVKEIFTSHKKTYLDIAGEIDEGGERHYGTKKEKKFAGALRQRHRRIKKRIGETMKKRN